MARKRKAPPNKKGDAPRLRPFWSGTVTFGLVSIPVELVPATRDEHVPLRMLSPEGTPLARKYVRAKDGKPLSDDELVRGFDVEGELVPITDEELERVAPEQSRDIVIDRFVERDQLPARQFERSYLLLPASASTRAYHLLVRTMEQTGRVGVATFVMRGKQHLLALFAENGTLRGEIMRFPDELRAPDELGLKRVARADRTLGSRARKAVHGHLMKKLPDEMLHDDSREKLEALVAKKKKSGVGVVAPATSTSASAANGDSGHDNVVDLMQLLRKRLGVT